MGESAAGLGKSGVSLTFLLLAFPGVLHSTCHVNGEKNGCKLERGAGTELGENKKI